METAKNAKDAKRSERSGSHEDTKATKPPEMRTANDSVELLTATC